MIYSQHSILCYLGHFNCNNLLSDPVCGKPRNFPVVFLPGLLRENSRHRFILPSVLIWALLGPFREVLCNSGSGAQASYRLFEGHDHIQILLVLDSKEFKIVLEIS